MKLEIGMYIRTEDGVIGKITNEDYKYSKSWIIDTLYYNFDENVDKWTCGVKEYEISKASHNIIDLIEEKDLVEIEYYSERYEERVTRLFEVSKYNQYLNFSNAKCEFFLSYGEFTEEDKELRPIIKSIVTKEQFEQMEYKVDN